jgi:TPR repeat protein
MGVTANVSSGAARLGQAAALGSDWACYVLGLYHQKGEYGFVKSAAEASFYYDKVSKLHGQAHE